MIQRREDAPIWREIPIAAADHLPFKGVLISEFLSGGRHRQGRFRSVSTMGFLYLREARVGATSRGQQGTRPCQKVHLISHCQCLDIDIYSPTGTW